MVTLFLGVGLQNFTSDINTATTLCKSSFFDVRNICTIFVADSNNLLDVMRKVLEDIQNQNHVL